MDDDRVRLFEQELWLGGEEIYRAAVDEDCLMVLPHPPHAMRGPVAIEAVSNTPRWSSVAFSDLVISRPQAGIIVLAYRAAAERGEERYEAWCSSTYRRIEHESWTVIQHQQTPCLHAPLTD